jgi:hypothetical protein
MQFLRDLRLPSFVNIVEIVQCKGNSLSFLYFKTLRQKSFKNVF